MAWCLMAPSHYIPPTSVGISSNVFSAIHLWITSQEVRLNLTRTTSPGGLWIDVPILFSVPDQNCVLAVSADAAPSTWRPKAIRYNAFWKDLATVLSLTWQSPYMGKTVFILRRSPEGGVFYENRFRPSGGKSTTWRWRPSGWLSQSQLTHDAIISLLHQNDITTSFRRNNDIVTLRVRAGVLTGLRMTGVCGHFRSVDEWWNTQRMGIIINSNF